MRRDKLFAAGDYVGHRKFHFFVGTVKMNVVPSDPTVRVLDLRTGIVHDIKREDVTNRKYKPDPMPSVQPFKAMRFALRLVHLCHGSGVDCDWHLSIENKGRNIVARNSFHFMDGGGYYDGYGDFVVKIPVDRPEKWTLSFTGDNATQKKVREYMVRDYLEDTFAFIIEDADHARSQSFIKRPYYVKWDGWVDSSRNK